MAVIDMPAVMEFVSFTRKYEGIPKYPAVTRDISMIMPKDILVGAIEEIILKCGGANLESYKLFDVYEGAQVGEGNKSVAYSITFRAKDRTLLDTDIAAPMDKIYKTLEKHGVEVRK